MTTLTEGKRAGECVITTSGTRSYDAITVALGEDLGASTVLGKVTKDDAGGGAAVADAGNTGDGAMGAITVGAGAKAGDYRLVFVDPATNAGAFTVEDPDGVNVGTGDVAAAFSGGGLGFTLADGAADFVVGDGFTITVSAGSGEYKQLDTAETDGSEVAAAILHDAVDASAAAKSGVALTRDAEVNDADLTWPTGISAGDKTAAIAALASQGIIVRGV